MLGRLILGILKGLVIGGLVGFGLAKIGFGAPGILIAYAAAALVGVLTGLVAGKPIWAKDAKIEAGMKAGIGALLGAGLMFAARKWLTFPLPIALGELGGANASLGEVASTAGTIGGQAITALAGIAAVLGGIYDADNTPEDAASSKQAEPASRKRIAAAAADDDDAIEDEADADAQKRAKK